MTHAGNSKRAKPGPCVVRCAHCKLQVRRSVSACTKRCVSTVFAPIVPASSSRSLCAGRRAEGGHLRPGGHCARASRSFALPFALRTHRRRPCPPDVLAGPPRAKLELEIAKKTKTKTKPPELERRRGGTPAPGALDSGRRAMYAAAACSLCT